MSPFLPLSYAYHRKQTFPPEICLDLGSGSKFPVWLSLGPAPPAVAQTSPNFSGPVSFPSPTPCFSALSEVSGIIIGRRERCSRRPRRIRNTRCLKKNGRILKRFQMGEIVVNTAEKQHPLPSEAGAKMTGSRGRGCTVNRKQSGDGGRGTGINHVRFRMQNRAHSLVMPEKKRDLARGQRSVGNGWRARIRARTEKRLGQA